MQTRKKHEARAIPELSTLPGDSFYWALRLPCRTDLDGRLTSIGFVLSSSDIPLSVFPCLPLPLIPLAFSALLSIPCPDSRSLCCFPTLSLIVSSVSQSRLPFVTGI